MLNRFFQITIGVVFRSSIEFCFKVFELFLIANVPGYVVIDCRRLYAIHFSQMFNDACFQMMRDFHNYCVFLSDVAFVGYDENALLRVRHVGRLDGMPDSVISAIPRVRQEYHPPILVG